MSCHLLALKLTKCSFPFPAINQHFATFKCTGQNESPIDERNVTG